MKKFYPLAWLYLMLLVLSGCLYPQDELSKNHMPNDSQLEMVQTAVDQYKEETNGLVPIKTKNNDEDQYEKYLIDFTLLKDHQLLSEIPGTAYENGGIYQYIILTPEKNPRVKVIDLRLSEIIRELHTKINMYRSEHTYPPFGKQIEKGIYQINYKKLGYQEEPYVISPFSNENLPIIMTESGDIFIDYRIDLKMALEKYDHSFKNGEDIRSILEDNYPVVPAYSLPYTIKNGDPIFLF